LPVRVTGASSMRPLATLLRADGDAVGDRRSKELFYRSVFERVASSQVAALRIAFQQSLALEEAADAPARV
jgi:hypothetical protein